VKRRLVAAAMVLAGCASPAVAAESACPAEGHLTVGELRMAIAGDLRDLTRTRILAPFDGGSALAAEVGVIAYYILAPLDRSAWDGTVLVTTTLAADAETVATAVTAPLEDALSQVAGIEALASISEPGRSQIAARFEDARRVAAAQDAVRSVLDTLPPEVDPPTVAALRPGPAPVLHVTLSGDQYPLGDLTEMADRFLGDKLRRVRGVAALRGIGEWAYAVRIELDPERLTALGLTHEDIVQAIAAAGVQTAATEGQGEGLSADAGVDLGALSELVIKEIGGAPVRLEDVARLERRADGRDAGSARPPIAARIGDNRKERTCLTR
jgi:Cu/Ag efflux pump CusA